MATNNMHALHQTRTGDGEGNQSVAGEEDPGASLDSVPAGRPPSDGTKQDALMLQKAVARWENEGGAEVPEADATGAPLPGAAVRSDAGVTRHLDR